MEDQGIMALPQGMPGEDSMEASPAAPTVTSMDSYDAAQTALGMNNPDQLSAAKEEIRASLSELQLTPSELNSIIEMLEYLSQNPSEYPAIRAQLIQQDYIDPEDLPEQYDAEYIGTMLIVLNELKATQAQGAQAPMMSEPPIEGMAPMEMAKGGLADVAQYLASQGRNGDSILAHITPEEAQLLKARGGSGTINPVTGLPEFFLKKLFRGVKKVFKGIGRAVKKVLQSKVGRIIATIALATVLGPAGVGLSMSTAAGLAGAGTTLAAGGSIKEALIAGAMGYVGGGGTIMGASPVAAVGQYLPGAAGSALNTGLATGAIGTGVGLVAGMSPAEALKMGAMSGVSAAALQGLRPVGAGEAAPIEARTSPTAPQGVGTAADLAGAPSGTPGMVAGAGPADVGIGSIGTAQEMLGQNPNMAPQALAPMQAPAASSAFAPGPGTPPADYMDSMYRDIGINPDNMVKQTGPFPSNVQIERSALGMTGIGDTANQLMRDPLAVGRDVYDQYLSPDRPGLPKDAGIIRRYAPLAAVGMIGANAAGLMDRAPATEPLFNAKGQLEDERRQAAERQAYLDRMGYGVGTYTPGSVSLSDVVTPASAFYNTIPRGPASTYVPMGATLSPAGVAQPYNVSGMYGVPLLYGPSSPRGYAEGGELRPQEFPRRTGPIDGPGTGTSDSIPAMLSDGEFVFTAKAVRNAGGGSRRKGAARMYKMMKMLEGGPVKAK